MSANFPERFSEAFQGQQRNVNMAQWARDQARFNEELGDSIAEAGQERKAKEDGMHDELLGAIRDVEQKQAQLRDDQRAQGKTDFRLTLAVLIVAVMTLAATIWAIVAG